MNKRLIGYCFALLVLVHALFSLSHIASTYLPDFSVFYTAAKGLIDHKNIYTLSMYTGLGYPPFALLPFLPLTFLSYPLASGLWSLGSFGLFLLCSYLSLRLVKKHVSLLDFSLVSSVTFLAFPSKFTLGMGQVNFLALTFLLMSLWFWQQKKYGWGGMFLGMVLVVKPHFLFFLPVYLIAGQWMVMMISLGVVAVGVLVTGMLFGWQQYVYYFNVVVPPLAAFSGRDIYYNQSLGSLFTRLVPLRLASDLTLWGSTLLVIVALWFIWWKGVKLFEAILVFIPVFLMVEPLSWQHHYVFLLPVYVWAWWKTDKKYLLVISYLLVAANIRSPASFLAFPFSPVLLSHVFVGNALLLIIVVSWLYKGKKIV